MPSLKELLSQTGGDTASFDTIGRAYEGTVVATDVRQATDFDTRAPRTWENGDPVLQAVITIETADRANGDDDGRRSIYVKWWGQNRQNLQAAVARAGAEDVEVGGYFKAWLAEEAPSKVKGGNAAKILDFEYRRPSALGNLMKSSNGSASAPVQAPPSPPNVAGDKLAEITQVRTLAAAGLTPAQISVAMPQFTADTVAAILNVPV